MKHVECPLCGADNRDYIFPLSADPGRINGYNYVECPGCRIAYLNPMPEPSELDAHYSRTFVGARVAPLDEFKIVPARRKIIDSLGLSKARDRLLDVGSGNGEVVYCLMKDGWDITGADPFYPPRGDCPDLNGRIMRVLVSDAGFPDAHFSLITLWQVLEHALEPAALLDELARILKPGGYLVISVPDYNTLQRAVLKNFWPGFAPPEHVAVYSERGLRRYLARRNLSLVTNAREPLYDQWMFKNAYYHKKIAERGGPADPQLSKNFSKLQRSLIGALSFAFVRVEALAGKAATANLVFTKNQ